MSQALQFKRPAKTDRRVSVPSTTSLDVYGDVLNAHELSKAIGRSERVIRREEKQGTFPIPRIEYGNGKNPPRQYRKAAVRRFLERVGR